MSIRAIETEYAGHRFRSRLEARWAVFFDAAGIAWQYELQGFEDTETGFRYLPDFHLPKTNGGVYFEVKGEKPKDEYVINATGVTPRPLVFAVGDIDKCSLWWLDLETPGDMDPHRSVRFNSGTDTMAPYLIDLMGYGRPPASAIRKAQQARFEHGEKPQTPKAVAVAPPLGYEPPAGYIRALPIKEEKPARAIERGAAHSDWTQGPRQTPEAAI